MAAQVLPSIDALRQCLGYNPDTGMLTWVARPSKRCGIRVGDEAFAPVSKALGYKTGGVLRWKGPAHRVIWAIHYGEWPQLSVDHINGDKTDNRIANLRLATNAQNRANQGKYVGNSKKGAQRVKTARAKPWRSKITHNGVAHHLGYFRCETAAHFAYLAAAKKIHGAFARFTA